MKLVLGTMTFSDQVDRNGTAAMLELFADQGHRELDTAYQYNDGKTETLLGELGPRIGSLGLVIATKANPWDGDGLKPAEIHKQVATSLERLQRDSVDLLYLHAPDLDTPIAESLAAVAELDEAGCFERFGLSNFAAWQVAEVVELCRARGWRAPTVYQGLYNALNRDVERELFPCLRNYGISFYAYNPLAGGLLTGKHRALDAAPQPGRFSDNKAYQDRYWKADYFASLDRFVAACEAADLTPTEAALRWLVHHSRMSGDHDDAIILGASRIDHLEQNLAAARGGELPKAVTDALDQGWDNVKADCFRYFRP